MTSPVARTPEAARRRLTAGRPPEALTEPILICQAPTARGICGAQFYERAAQTRQTGAHKGRRRAPHCSHDLTWAVYADPASGRVLVGYSDGEPA